VQASSRAAVDMSHKFSNVLVHLVFSTKNRRDFLLDVDLRMRVWKYFAGVRRNHGISVLSAGGTANHAHLLIAMPSDMSVAKAVQVLKANTSRWIRQHGIEFMWQEGYGAFSVSPSHKGIVESYIQNQIRHHASKSYEDEFLTILGKMEMISENEHVFG
jgi:putative transposase